MRSLEKLIESLILASHWLLVVFYLGLAAALAIYAFAFVLKLGSFAQKVMMLGETGEWSAPHEVVHQLG